MRRRRRRGVYLFLMAELMRKHARLQRTLLITAARSTTTRCSGAARATWCTRPASWSPADRWGVGTLALLACRFCGRPERAKRHLIPSQPNRPAPLSQLNNPLQFKELGALFRNNMPAGTSMTAICKQLYACYKGINELQQAQALETAAARAERAGGAAPTGPAAGGAARGAGGVAGAAANAETVMVGGWVMEVFLWGVRLGSPS
jgi:hypothetical protein